MNIIEKYNHDVGFEKLNELSKIDPENLTTDDHDLLFNAAINSHKDETKTQAAVLISKVYSVIADKNPEFAKKTHIVFIKHLLKSTKHFGHPTCNWLAVTHLHGENLSDIPWDSVDEVKVAAEGFYNVIGTELDSHEINRRVRDLVKYAGLQFTANDRWEDLFKLISGVHVADDVLDDEFYRLKNSALLYEQRRVERLRGFLSYFIIIVLVFVSFVSPLLFMISENDFRQSAGMETLSYFDSFYWSIITAGTVGYGDIVPYTFPGRILAMINSLLVIILLGVVAGLILSYLTPRSIG